MSVPLKSTLERLVGCPDCRPGSAQSNIAAQFHRLAVKGIFRSAAVPFTRPPSISDHSVWK